MTKATGAQPMAKVYLDTNLVSYLVARRSRDLLMAARQQLTLNWWEQERNKYELFISEMVLREARLGDPDEVIKRLAALDGLPQLDLTDEVARLADQLLSKGVLPHKAARDAVHIAVATVHRMDFLLTWNFKHIANAHVRKMADRLFRQANYELPVICTPEELE